MKSKLLRAIAAEERRQRREERREQRRQRRARRTASARACVERTPAP
jgi:hypothetical protein